MSKAKVTLNELTKSVRELSFDRFVVPAIALKEMGEGYFVEVDQKFVPPTSTGEVIKGVFKIKKKSKDAGGTVPKEETIVELLFQEYRTLEELMEALIDEGIVVAYTPYFKGSEPCSQLIPVKEKELLSDVTLFRRNFFSAEEVKSVMSYYYDKVLNIPGEEITDELVGRIIRPREGHLVLWVAYHLVDMRRMYESASVALSQTYTDGSDYVGTSDITGVGTTTTVNIGSVFSITEDPTKGFFSEDFGRVGSDNTWGDRYSFWYRLMLYLRNLLEEKYGDYSLRKDTVIPGQTQLIRDLDFRSYFDSYPFTISPLSRGLLSKKG